MCNGDISPFETIAYPGGGSDNFRVADYPPRIVASTTRYNRNVIRDRAGDF